MTVFTDRVQRILNEAAESKSKGNYITYTYYKLLIAEEDLPFSEYEQAIQQLAKVLRV